MKVNFITLFYSGVPKPSVYGWPLRPTEEEKLEQQQLIENQKDMSPEQEARVNAVTNDLMEWEKGLVRKHDSYMYT